jgi:hypothetical protein
MSSLAAASADGYYFPPEWEPKRGGLSKYNTGSRGNNQFQLKGVLRFELPFDCWCTNPDCGRHIGRGTRFNAKKLPAGEYFSTKIWEFEFTCPDGGCGGRMAIATDPEHRTYRCVRGIRRKIEEFEAVEGDGTGKAPGTLVNGDSTIGITAGDSAKTLEALEDPMFQIEKNEIQVIESATQKQRLEALMALKAAQQQSGGDVAANSVLRKQRRAERKRGRAQARESNAFFGNEAIDLAAQYKYDLRGYYEDKCSSSNGNGAPAHSLPLIPKEDLELDPEYQSELRAFRVGRGERIFTASNSLLGAARQKRRKGEKSVRKGIKRASVRAPDASTCSKGVLAVTRETVSVATSGTHISPPANQAKPVSGSTGCALSSLEGYGSSESD